MKFYRIVFMVILILCSGVILQAQELKVSGTVTDATTGEGIAGVNVVVKGTSTGTITSIDGNYSISVSSGAALLFSFVGYVTEEYTVSSSTLNVSMTEDVTSLQEVVVSGLASTVKRTNLANSVASISGAELTGIATQQTMDGALYGKFKGANISANSGAPGGGISIKLRGLTSINGSNEPLYIIDGVYIDNSAISAGLNVVSQAAGGGSQSNQDNPSNRIADLDPEDIQSIEILKGASAAAIYGSRASGGVIIITTKKGQQGKAQISLSQTLGWTQMLNPLGQRSWDETKVAASFGASEVPNFVAARNAGKLIDYEDELYGNKGLLSTSRITVTGGGDRTTYFVAATRKNDEAIVKNTGYEKNSFRLNLENALSERVKLNLNTNYIESSTDRGLFSNDNSGATMGVSFVSTPSWAQLLPDANGNYPNNPYSASNFLQTRDLITNNESVKRIITGLNLDAVLLKRDNMSLRLNARGGIDNYTLVTTALFPNTLQFQSDGNGTNGVSIQGTTTNRNTNMAAFLIHDFFPGSSGLSFRTQFGITGENFDRNNIVGTASFLNGSQTNLDQSGSVTIEQDRLIQKDRGFFAQEEINLNDQIIATVGLRGDKSSNNGDPNKLYYYPKASLAVNLTEFSFWNIEPINQFKLRVAYGEAGNFAVFGDKFISLEPVNINGNSGLTVSNLLGNQEIGPERQKEFETGFDVTALNNKISLDFTYYVKTVEDLLLRAQIPASTGQTTKVVNAAEMVNKGIEIGLNGNVINTSTLKWTSRLSYWSNDTEVTRLDVPSFTTGGFADFLGQYRIKEGHSPTEIIGVGPNPDEDGLVVFGDAQPDFNLSFLNSVTWKNFELSMLWHWKKGGDNINLTALLSDLSGTSADYDKIDLDPDKQLGNGDYRLSVLGANTEPYIEDASYLRMREIGVYYNLPKTMLGNFLNSVKVGFSGRNLINIFDYRSYDPEVSNFGGKGLSSSVEVTQYPSSKNYNFHLLVKF